MKYLIILCLLIFIGENSFAQKRTNKKKVKTSVQKKSNKVTLADTTKKEFNIYSSFKPSLRTSAKINFSAASPAQDTSSPKLTYNVPSQNLFFTYEPVNLKPLAYAADTSVEWSNQNFVKVGFGNFSTPYAEVGLSLGDGQNALVMVHARHTSSKGKLYFQQFSNTSANVIGVFSPNENNEWITKLSIDNNIYYKYGYQPDTLKFTKDELKQRFTNFGVNVGFRNKVPTQFGISYYPTAQLRMFSDNNNGKEFNFILNAPISKSFGRMFAFDLALNADITNYKAATTVNNNLFSIAPAIKIKTPNFHLTTGLIPTWDNSTYRMLPNFSTQLKIKGEKFVLLAGLIGYYNKTNYMGLANFNPWLQQPTSFLNTRITETYAGLKGSGGAHFTYNAKISSVRFYDQPLFVNDTVDGKSFKVVNESDMRSLRIHGEIGYSVQEKFSLLAGLTMNNYSSLKNNDKAWGLPPLELTAALRWHLSKDLLVKSDLFFWDGSQYQNKAKQSQKLKPAIDFNLGIEFSVLKKINLWLQCNNLFNNTYERWNQYQVLGFNVLGGFVYSFSK
jgi:hypothetical protein